MLQILIQRLNQFHPRQLSSTSRWLVVGTWLSYVLFLFVLTHTPVPKDLAETTSRWDKVLHFGAYAVLCGLTCLAYFVQRPGKLPVFKVALGLMIYAAFDEFTQGFVGRTPDFADWVADGAGVIGCMVVIQLVFRFARTHSSPDWLSDFLTQPTSVETVAK